MRIIFGFKTSLRLKKSSKHEDFPLGIVDILAQADSQKLSNCARGSFPGTEGQKSKT
jgi:hypothetical protein